MRRRRDNSFKTEADLCAAFLKWVRISQPGWTPYPETEGWDILLAHADGTQIGIQAKLRFNIAVLEQAVEPHNVDSQPGPDYRAVLVPAGCGSRTLSAALGLTMITARKGWDGKYGFYPDLCGGFNRFEPWHYCNPDKRLRLPEYLPDSRAGVPSPSPLTPWKVAALKICAILRSAAGSAVLISN